VDDLLRKAFVPILLAAAAALQACGSHGGTTGSGTPPNPPPPPSSGAFTEVSRQAGVYYIQDSSAYPSQEASFTGGAAVGDYDNDGRPDLLVTRYDAPPILYHNKGDGTFEDRTAGSGILVPKYSSAAAWGDVNNDGYVDLVITQTTPTASQAFLFINNGNGTFTEQAQARGTAGAFHRSTNVAFGDYDRDGYLDIFISDWDFNGGHSRLFHNLGAANPGYFEDKTNSVGVAIDGLRAHTAAWADMNNDGWPDLVITGDFGDSRLYFNNGNGTFTDGTYSAQVGHDKFGMGSTIGDLDNNGSLDWFVTSIWRTNEVTGNRLYMNSGNRTFIDATSTYGVANGGWGWGTTFLDYDNDGDLDLIMTGGSFKADIIGQGGSNPYSSLTYDVAPQTLMWVNNGGTLQESAAALGVNNPGGYGQGLVKFDYNGDGNLDLLIVNAHGRPALYRNNAAAGKQWLRVNTVGTVSNRDGIGARVTIHYGQGKTQIDEVSASGSYMGQNEKTLHFGLGNAAVNGVVDSVEIRWPSGHVQTLTNVAVNQVLTVTEPNYVIDQDGDGIADLQDNCAAVYNPDQADMDHDGIGDACDPDIDGDGLPNWVETNTGKYVSPSDTGTDPRKWDSDGDGMSDGVETNSGVFVSMSNTGTDPNKVDTDGDGISDLDELAMFHTNPFIADTSLHVSVARFWDEDILNAIRTDVPNPPRHARNLFHLAAAMWDAWAAYDPVAVGYIDKEKLTATDPDAARAEAMSYAAYRILMQRYATSPNANPLFTPDAPGGYRPGTLASFDRRMRLLGYDTSITTTLGSTPAALGNRIAQAVLDYGLADGSNEQNGYADTTGYVPVNAPLIVKQPGVGTLADPTLLADPNRWQPLALDSIVTQNGIVLPDKVQTIVGPQWGKVTPFALTRGSPSTFYNDPGPPPRLGGTATDDLAFKTEINRVIRLSGYLSPDDGVTIDIAPGALGNNTLGTNDGTGRTVNPKTGQPYVPNIVRRGDFQRVLAEYWADGPNSETPPGHWNVLGNYVTDHLAPQDKHVGGVGPAVNDLEWNVKLYFALNGALHDAAIQAWGLKRIYDTVRPITAIRYMGGLGQSSDQTDPATYNPGGLMLEPGLVEVITPASSAPGQRHASLAQFVGQVAVHTWPGNPQSPATQYSGVQWILAATWVPYQKSTFVTPSFPAYVSGHSTFSRAGAEVLTAFTNDAFFPGGLGTFTARQNQFLQFELGPTQDLQLQWATYYDAADQAGYSRLSGGIHVDADDLTGRKLGSRAGIGAWQKAQTYYSGVAQ
jgi:hypothetical protein